MTTPIERDELRNRLDSDAETVLLEALPERYYQEGHLPGARQVPHEPAALTALAPRLLPDRDAFIVVYCASERCNNSQVAASTLVSLGYRQVHKYIEGKQGWTDAGFPLERDQVRER